jgi:hypothetical protein
VQFRADQARSCAYKLRNSGEGAGLVLAGEPGLADLPVGEHRGAEDEGLDAERGRRPDVGIHTKDVDDLAPPGAGRGGGLGCDARVARSDGSGSERPPRGSATIGPRRCEGS